MLILSKKKKHIYIFLYKHQQNRYISSFRIIKRNHGSLSPIKGRCIKTPGRKKHSRQTIPVPSRPQNEGVRKVIFQPVHHRRPSPEREPPTHVSHTKKTEQGKREDRKRRQAKGPNKSDGHLYSIQWVQNLKSKGPNFSPDFTSLLISHAHPLKFHPDHLSVLYISCIPRVVFTCRWVCGLEKTILYLTITNRRLIDNKLNKRKNTFFNNFIVDIVTHLIRTNDQICVFKWSF